MTHCATGTLFRLLEKNPPVDYMIQTVLKPDAICTHVNYFLSSNDAVLLLTLVHGKIIIVYLSGAQNGLQKVSLSVVDRHNNNLCTCFPPTSVSLGPY